MQLIYTSDDLSLSLTHTSLIPIFLVQSEVTLLLEYVRVIVY